MKLRLSQRILKPDFQGDFVKMILKAASSPDIISFAGGLPNPVSFPIAGLKAAAAQVLDDYGSQALQYSTSRGYLPLRQFIADQYRRRGLAVDAGDILITNGSQQAIDTLAAVMIDAGDSIIVERPSYLAALQIFHLYDPTVHTVELTDSGADIEDLRRKVAAADAKFFYTVPTFQNPTGVTYTDEIRRQVAAIIKESNTLLVEDNPYGQLRFSGQEPLPFHSLLGEQCVMLGSFSKIVSPGIRIGWICSTNKQLSAKLLDYKQDVDVHTNILSQMILSTYLEQNDLDEHIKTITALYRHQMETMYGAIKRCFPADVKCAKPDGGMFMWVTLPDNMKAVDLAAKAIEAGVAIAAGDPFYETDRNVNTFRLNYTNCDDATINKGIAILGRLIGELRRQQ